MLRNRFTRGLRVVLARKVWRWNSKALKERVQQKMLVSGSFWGESFVSPKRWGEAMETVQEVKVRVYIRTDKRTVEKEFENVHELRWFMNNFFSTVAERRSSKSLLRYTGPERRMPSWLFLDFVPSCRSTSFVHPGTWPRGYLPTRFWTSLPNLLSLITQLLSLMSGDEDQVGPSWSELVFFHSSRPFS